MEEVIMASANAVYSFLNVLIEKSFWKICDFEFPSFWNVAAWLNVIIGAACFFVGVTRTSFDNIKVFQLGVF